MAKGDFIGRDGHRYEVEFTGNGVSGRSLDIAGVTISMGAAERKFVGFKSTTCQVQLLTNEPIVELYAAGVRDIAVTIVDKSVSTEYEDYKVVFVGYVVPFAFEQPYTGMLDSVTIDCVDAITASKDMPYRSSNDGDDYGVDEEAVYVVEDAISRAGSHSVIKRMLFHTNFDWTNAGTTALSAKVAQAGFLQDGMTSLDALNAVCLFFGYTCSLVGDTLCFYDEHCLTHADAWMRRNAIVKTWYKDINGKTQTSTVNYYVSDDSPLRLVDLDGYDIHNDITVSIERAYDGIKITPSGSSVSVLLPDVCSDENVERNTDGRGTESALIMGSVDGQEYWEYRKPIQSSLMEMGEFVDGETREWSSPNQLEATGAGVWRNGAMMIRGEHYDISNTDLGIFGDSDYEYFKSSTKKNMIWMRAYDKTPLTRCGYQLKKYSHTGGYVELKFSYRYVLEDWRTFTKEYVHDVFPVYTSFAQIKFGDQYYFLDYAHGQSATFKETAEGKIDEYEAGKKIPTHTAFQFFSDKFILPSPNSGQVAVELGWDANPMSEGIREEYPGIFIDQLELVGYGDEIWEEHPDLLHHYVEDPKELLEVETILTTRASKQSENKDNVSRIVGVNARPSIVPGKYFPCGGYMGRAQQEEMPLCGILMEQLRSRYGEAHKRYAMTVEGYIAPTDTVRFLGSDYTLEAYEWDVMNNTTHITIN